MSNLESDIADAPTSATPPTESGPDITALALIEEHILPRLDPVFIQYLVDVVSKQPPSHLIPLEDVRANPDKYRSPIAVDTSRHERVSDHVVSSQDGASITVRVYHPDPVKFGPGPYPVHMNHHGMHSIAGRADCRPPGGIFGIYSLTEAAWTGGGFVLGDLQSEAQLCLRMREAGVVVIDVNYRHCPGWRHPSTTAHIITKSLQALR